MTPQDDIIAAIATPIGEGGISVLRVSGKGSIELCDKKFRKGGTLASAPSHTAHFGEFTGAKGEVIDEVVATVFKAPKSYTGEDTVEVSCHGGMFLTRKILESILRSGARSAEPGEFTKRAYLNGRIDLSQAEAIADLIKARSEDSLRVSLLQLQGRLSGKIGELREKLLRLCGLIELELDFAEEGIEIADKSSINNELTGIIEELLALIDSYEYGKLYREGVKVVLTGRPNVGKSSILNALLSEERAIVTEIPGTTRDVIHESFNIGGLLFNLTDTAGLRESDNEVERQGILRTHRELGQADIVAFVVEAGNISEAEWALINMLRDEASKSRRIILVINKIDLRPGWKLELPKCRIGMPVSYMSAKSMEGLDTFREQMAVTATQGNGSNPEKSLIVTNERQRDSFVRAVAHLHQAQKDLAEGKSNELIAVSVRLAVDNLGEIIGSVATDDVLNTIFSSFCIGK
jgi:tRNA modification GTPase